MAGRSSSIDVFLRLHGQRQFAKEVTASGAELEAMGLKGAKSMAAFAQKAESLKKFGRSWTRNVSMPIAGLGVIAGGMAVNFKRQMGLVATDAGGSAREVSRLEKSVLGLSRESQFGPQQLAESLFHVESSGYRGAKAMKVLNESQKLATTGNSELQSTTYALVSATKSLYGESLHNVNRTAAELNGIVAHGDMRLEELTSAMSTGVIPKAKSMGLNLRDVGAAMDVMTARGIPAQRAAYALGFTMQKLVPYGEKAEAAFESIGLGQETLVNASKNGKYGYVTGLEVLQKHLDRLPTKPQQTKVIEEMFGGGRMTSGMLTDLQNLGEMKTIYKELGDEVQVYSHHVHEAEQQPLVKLKKAWSNIQASLVEIGSSLLPVAVPGLEKMAHVASTLGTDFAALPGPVKALGIGFLVLTGPVASGLGYFASGVGKALVLSMKLAQAGKSLQIFSSALQSGQGLSGSWGMALSGGGAAAALETAKGFARALTPAIAAYGAYEIGSSAVQGNFATAGTKLGYSLVGGILGTLVEPGAGTLAGVGIGAWLGGRVASVLGIESASQSKLVQKLAQGSKESAYWFGEQAKASQALVGAEGRLVAAHHRQHAAISGVKDAQAHLTAMVRKYGPDTRPVLRAEGALAQKRWGVAKATRAVHDSERLRGIALAGAKASFRWSIASEKEQIHLLDLRAKRLGHLFHYEQFHGADRERLGELGKRIGNVLGALRGEERKLKITGGNAAKEVGDKWARAMLHMNVALLKFETNPFETKLDHLGKNPAPQKLSEGIRELGKQGDSIFEHLIHRIKRTNQAAEELEQRSFPNFNLPGVSLPHTRHHGTLGPPTPHSPLTHPRHAGTSAPKHRTVPRVALADFVGGRDITINVVSELDGKVLAENQVRHVRKAANRA